MAPLEVPVLQAAHQGDAPTEDLVAFQHMLQEKVLGAEKRLQDFSDGLLRVEAIQGEKILHLERELAFFQQKNADRPEILAPVQKFQEPPLDF
jgi:hypothetical protein